eukprot:94813_1
MKKTEKYKILWKLYLTYSNLMQMLLLINLINVMNGILRRYKLDKDGIYINNNLNEHVVNTIIVTGGGSSTISGSVSNSSIISGISGGIDISVLLLQLLLQLLFISNIILFEFNNDGGRCSNLISSNL